jgi:3',5'-cyclic AMP phosphodiesterase CpdA
MRLAWLTDTHFDFVGPDTAAALLTRVVEGRPDAVLISGDIAVAKTLAAWLRILDRALQLPVYFVLGNHDYYGGSLAGVRTAARAAVAASDRLTWLSEAEPVILEARTALIGHGGWGDGRLGDYAGSPVRLNDFVLIAELTGLDHETLGRVLRGLGDEAAAHLERQLAAVRDDCDEVLVLTHVPPFAEASLHLGKPAHPHWLPHFACGATGEVLRAAAQARPERRFTVLCGHTHDRADCWVLPNLHVRVGAAAYRRPDIEDWLAWPPPVAG